MALLPVLEARVRICNLAEAQHTFHNFITTELEELHSKAVKTVKKKKKKKKKKKENEKKYCSSITLRVHLPIPFWVSEPRRRKDKTEFTITTYVLTHGQTGRSEVTARLIELFNSKYQPTATASSSSPLSWPKVEVYKQLAWYFC